MFDKRILALIPEARRFVIAAVVLKWLALVGRVCVLALVGWMCGMAIEGTGIATDLAAGGGRLAALRLVALAAAGALLSYVCSSGARYAGSLAAGAAKSTVRREVYHKLIELGPAYEEHIAAGAAVQVVGEGAERLEAYFGKYLPQFFFAVLAPLTLFFVVLPISLPVAVALLACVPLIPMSIVMLMKVARRVMGDYWDSYIDLGADFLDAIRGLTTLKVYRADAVAHDRLNARAEEFRRTTMRLLRVQLNSVTLMDLFAYGGAAVGTVVALVQSAHGAIGVPQLLVVVVLAIEFFLPMRTLGSYFHTGMGAQTVIDQVFEILDVSTARRGEKDVDEGPVDIVCEGVGFAYSGAACEPVAEAGAAGGPAQGADGAGALCDGACRRVALADVDLVVEDGSYIGITGASGSGKTTLADVMTGRHDAYTGSVRLGGVELREASAQSLHRTVTYVGSHSHVFKGSVRSNLLLGNADATDPQMWEALKRCRLHNDVLAMGGLDAEVAEGGRNLSGGQCQRLCVARALLHDTPVYVFDEATSNVDAESESAILAFIQELAITKTVVVISHRLAVLRWTDRIYVLDCGRVVEHGSHSGLIGAGGTYARLWEQQERLERFARDVAENTLIADAKVAPGPVVTEAQERAMEQMPGKVADLMYMAIEAKPIREAITGRKESGHPSWIPRPQGATRPQDAVSVGAVPSAGSPSTAAPDAAAPGAGPSTEAREQGAPEAEATRRTAAQVVVGLAKATKEQVPATLRAVACGIGADLVATAIPVAAAAGALGIAGVAGGLPLPVAIAVVALCGLGRGPLRYGERLGTHDQTFRTLALIRDRVFGAMRRLAPAKLQRRDVGDLVALVTTDVELLEAFYSRALAPTVAALVSSVVVAAFLLATVWQLAVVALVAYAVIGVFVPVVVNRAVEPHGRSIRERAVFMSSFILDTLHGLGEVLQFGWAQERASQMDERMDELSGDEGRFGLKSAFASSAGMGLGLVFSAVAAVAACGLVAQGAVGVGAAVLGVVAVACSLQPVVAVAELGASFHQTLAAGERILELLDERPQTPEIVGGVVPVGFSGAEVRDVDFAYGSKAALLKANLVLETGRVTAVTGSSGSGKSTLLKLLMRFWDAQGGVVEVCGTDVREIDTCALRASEGYMEQETYLFAGTVRDNLLFVRPDATDGQLADAIERASLRAFVERLPQGLDTVIGTGGSGVSDGERQRIGLARLFLYDAPFCLLDEPTSNLDTVNEAAVLRAIHENRAGRTILIVSHRPSVASIADVVYRMGG